MPDPQPRPESDPEMADASLFFAEPEPPEPSPVGPRSANLGEVYAVEGAEPGVESEAVPEPPVPRATRPQPRAGKAEAVSKKPKRRPSSGVDQLWSRAAEWGADLVRLGLALVGLGALLYATFRLDALAPWSVLLAFSAVGLTILAYPIFITLERPVRVTPEQAVKDYFGALSHRVPHYKRMWLLLSTDGRLSREFSDFATFRSYWTSQLARWKAEARSQALLNPLTVEVADFKSDKSAGQTEIDGEYSVRVLVPGRVEPVASYRVSGRFVWGADKMWYLETGTLD
jgi:hypothetical protein